MKHLYITIIILIGLSLMNNIHAQTHSGNLSLRTQEEVDNFQYNYIDGALSISGRDISNLEGLSILDSVSGHFNIQSTKLASLNGLQGLIKVKGFKIDQSDIVVVDHLDNLKYCEQFMMYKNPNLKSINVKSLQEVFRLDIRFNASLNNLIGLESIHKVSELDIGGNNALTSLEGLSNLDTIGALYVHDCNALRNFVGLNGLNSVHSVNIAGNMLLESLDGLDGVTQCEGRIVIGVNEVTKYESPNPSLRDFCAFTRIFQDRDWNANSSSQTIWIEHNKYNPQEAEFNGGLCSIPEDDYKILNSSITLSTQSMVDIFNFNYIAGDVVIESLDGDIITNINKLSCIDSIGGNFTIWNCTGLETLDGLENLKHVGKIIQIGQKSMWVERLNPKLYSLCAIRQLYLDHPEFGPEPNKSPQKSIAGNFFNPTIEMLEAGKCSNMSPNAVQCTSPSNDEIDIMPEDIIFEWTASTDPDFEDSIHYEIFLRNEDLHNFAGPYHAGSTKLLRSEMVASGQPVDNKSYEWFVLAKDDYGGVSSSDTCSFTTGDYNTYPSDVLLTNPEDGALDLDPLNVTISWEASTDEDGHSITYNVHLSTSRLYSLSDDNLLLEGLSETSCHLTNLEANTLYYWVVVAFDGRNYQQTVSNTYRSFKTAEEPVNSPPSVVSNQWPTDGADNIDRRDLTLSWDAATDADDDELSYSVYLSADENSLDLNPILENSSELSVQPMNLDLNTTYYWKVVVSDGIATTSCDVCKFAMDKHTGAKKNGVNNTILIYPNPNKSIVNIECMNGYQGNLEVCVYNASGQKVLIHSYTSVSSITLSHTLSHGVYSIQIKGADFIESRVLIVE